ncbi:hypothetical protein EYF80_046171 [Liparis tanakae]|uniref:Uncharacterized protein n=1 Tax=Liparis tanakae TaxID=230148 RepID=A0A4Z2FQW7_9TELE|nr:hypothetical protein EYF80_046171 [Liparis tanakae]
MLFSFTDTPLDSSFCWPWVEMLRGQQDIRLHVRREGRTTKDSVGWQEHVLNTHVKLTAAPELRYRAGDAIASISLRPTVKVTGIRTVEPWPPAHRRKENTK